MSESPARRPTAFGGVHAALAYLGIALWATWPLARGLGRDVAWDLGDPVLVIWALAWNCTQLLAILKGDTSRAATYFDANIFAPAPHTLAYSEHFFAQSVQVLPIYALTDNAILCYNLLYLSTFVLSGLGAFLFVRALTGDRLAAFAAGLVFAFAPYRFPQSSHLQVLSSQWMPLALYGFRRYFDTRRRLALAGAAAALIVQNLSCGYYFLYFSPFAAAYVIAEIAARRVWRDAVLWRQLALAGGAVLAVTVPFFVPYLTIRDLQPSLRQPAEVARYSADVYSYLTAFSEHPIWGRVQAFPRPEGELFPGIAAVLLAAIAVVPWPSRIAAASRPESSRWKRTAALVAGILAGAHVVVFITVLFARRLSLDLGIATLRASDATQLLLRAVFLGGLVLALNGRARARARAFLWPHGALLAGLLAAMWLSLGPAPTAMGRPLDLASPYRVLYDYVPGFDGVRVPSRFWMIGLLWLSALAGFGAARLATRRAGQIAVGAVCMMCLLEARVRPFVINGAGPVPGFNAPEARLRVDGDVPAIYHAVARQPAGTVLAELPLGPPDFDIRAMYYSTFHWRKVLNGYSGFAPLHYGRLVAVLGTASVRTDEAWAALQASGATAALVHEDAYLDGGGPRLSAALRERGAREVFRDGSDVLLTLR